MIIFSYIVWSVLQASEASPSLTVRTLARVGSASDKSGARHLLTITIAKKGSFHWMQRRQSGLKSGGSWIRVKKFGFSIKFSKNLDFFRQFHKQKADFSGQIFEKFGFFHLISQKISIFKGKFCEEFGFFREFHKKFKFSRKISQKFHFFRQFHKEIDFSGQISEKFRFF